MCWPGYVWEKWDEWVQGIQEALIGEWWIHLDWCECEQCTWFKNNKKIVDELIT